MEDTCVGNLKSPERTGDGLESGRRGLWGDHVCPRLRPILVSFLLSPDFCLKLSRVFGSCGGQGRDRWTTTPVSLSFLSIILSFTPVHGTPVTTVSHAEDSTEVSTLSSGFGPTSSRPKVCRRRRRPTLPLPRHSPQTKAPKFPPPPSHPHLLVSYVEGNGR